jgi:hypothetical protein
MPNSLAVHGQGRWAVQIPGNPERGFGGRSSLCTEMGSVCASLRTAKASCRVVHRACTPLHLLQQHFCCAATKSAAMCVWLHGTLCGAVHRCCQSFSGSIVPAKQFGCLLDGTLCCMIAQHLRVVLPDSNCIVLAAYVVAHLDSRVAERMSDTTRLAQISQASKAFNVLCILHIRPCVNDGWLVVAR